MNIHLSLFMWQIAMCFAYMVKLIQIRQVFWMLRLGSFLLF